MAIWTDQEWWDADIDKEAAEKALNDAGLNVVKWVNRKPICDPEEMERVQAIAAGQGSSPSGSEPAPKDSLPGPQPKRRKAGRKGM
jgi:hypothetical protein